MSSAAKEKKRLLKLSKTALIKRCKEYQLTSTGSKADMIQRIMKHENKDIISDKSKKKKRKPSEIKKPKKQKVILSRNALYFVVTGYIRCIQSLLAKNQIIPLDITTLCFHFLIPSNIFISLIDKGYDHNHELGLTIRQYHGKKPPKMKSGSKPSDYVFYQNSNIYQHYYGSTQYNYICRNREELIKYPCNLWRQREIEIIKLDKSIPQNFAFRYGFAYCKGLNVSLPPKVNKIIKSNKPNYDILFKSGGKNNTNSSYCSDECDAFIINDDHQTAKIFNWKLPDLPFKTCEHSMIYNIQYGLICIGGKKNNKDQLIPIKSVYTLKFDGQQYKKQDMKSSYIRKLWKWTKVHKMNETRVGAHSIMIGTKLFVCGGKSADWTRYVNYGWYGYHAYEYNHNRSHIKTVEMLDFIDSDNKWENLGELNYGRWNAAICYNKYMNSIFIGGGDGNSAQRIERFDINTNKWLNIANSKFGYYCKPVLWIDDIDPNILYICSSCLDGRIERIDMRMNNGYSQNSRQEYRSYEDICIRLY